MEQGGSARLERARVPQPYGRREAAWNEAALISEHELLKRRLTLALSELCLFPREVSSPVPQLALFQRPHVEMPPTHRRLKPETLPM